MPFSEGECSGLGVGENHELGFGHMESLRTPALKFKSVPPLK